mmetsp:Transcript_120819/g.301477  ORF Transcript_120819/g.301477 Transcript_120819/m.301477 type:complete len:627 (-) Transcript_120819:40-1920(-)
MAPMIGLTTLGLGAVMLLVTAAAQEACGAGQGSCLAQDVASLLQRPISIHGPADLSQQRQDIGSRGGKGKTVGDHSAIAGKSVYFVTVDRFAKPGANVTDPPCGRGEAENHWCGGMIKGITSKLDYIQDMGFDCVWITPVIKQFEGETPSGTGCMGYWAYDLYKIDENFGTPQDLKDLVNALHARNMCIVYDFVGNHMGPIHNEDMVKKMVPFNDTKYFNQLFRGKLSFDEYVKKDSDWPPPAQAMWSQSGAQCTQGMDCNCYTCSNKSDDPFGGCEGEMVWNPEGPCPEGAYSKYCMPGDYACEGYNETITHRGWFYDLGDLNQSDPFVRKTQLDWLSWFVKEYDIDVLRLDTAPFMTFDFLAELQAAAGVPILGEVTTTNMTFHAQFQADPPGSSQPVLDGVLNFPLYYTALSAFCGSWWPFSQSNLAFLGQRMEEQLSAPYTDLDTLGNFIDNHDAQRVMTVCGHDELKVANSLAWTMLTKGVPIIYYGTEDMLEEIRDSFWQYGYNTSTDGFKLIQTLNAVRKYEQIGVSPMQVIMADANHLVFTRGNYANSVWVFVNNLGVNASDVKYCGAVPASRIDEQWVDLISGSPLTIDFNLGCVLANDALPIVAVRAKETRIASVP